jgi:hypothetical protein
MAQLEVETLHEEQSMQLYAGYVLDWQHEYD